MSDPSSMPALPWESPDDDAVSVALLEQLREHAGTSVEYLELPVQLKGGFETFTYGFRVSSEYGQFSGPLILRLFRERGKATQGQREAAFQNALAGLGYPVPRVVLQVGSPGIQGRPFNVMDRVKGRPMIAENLDGGADLSAVSGWIARVHTRLHGVPVQPVKDAVERSGFPADAFSIWHRLSWLDRYFDEPAFAALLPVMVWLRDNRPGDRKTPVVCHGDFHPGNVMVDNGTVTGVIDWPGASFADAEHDVAVTLVLMGIVAGGLFPDGRELLQGFRAAYLDAYEERRALGHDRLEYYEVMRSYIGFVRGTASMTQGVNPELLPRDGYPWANEWVMQQSAARIREITGLALPLPDRD